MIASLSHRPMVFRAQVAAGGTPTPPVVAPVAAPALPAPQAPAAAGGTIVVLQGFFAKAMEVAGNMFRGIVNFVKRLFGQPVDDAATTLTPQDRALANQYQLQPSKANLDAFRAEVGTYAGSGTLGPGTGNADAVLQLRAALGRLGYQVSASGGYDEPLGIAVQRFKMDNNLHQTYRAANGQFAINEYATPEVLAVILQKLQKPR
ncbi:MAG: hypothetical protein FJY99_09275 [Candidatus Sericytochromatia bacterium]|nr:hypothetical protein [Candidatus Tanganyikabacteria bacterium]